MQFNFSPDLHGSDAAGVRKVPGPLPAGVVLLHHWTHSALRKGPQKPGQEPNQGLRGHILPAAEQRRIPHVRANLNLSFWRLMTTMMNDQKGLLRDVRDYIMQLRKVVAAFPLTVKLHYILRIYLFRLY